MKKDKIRLHDNWFINGILTGILWVVTAGLFALMLSVCNLSGVVGA